MCGVDGLWEAGECGIFWYAKFTRVGVQVDVMFLHDAFAVGVNPGMNVFGKPLREHQVQYHNVDRETGKGGCNDVYFHLIEIVPFVSITVITITVDCIIYP